MACPDVDGALVGGASLEAEIFLALLDFVKYSKLFQTDSQKY